jgi:KDO2-lipid IV(A) lauroyltransferase
MKKMRYLIEYWFTLAGAWFVQRLPLPAAQALGRGLGMSAYWLGAARVTTHKNLKERLGLGLAQRRRVALQAYAGFGQTMAELARMPVTEPASLDSRFEFEGLEILKAAREAGKGIVCLSAHYGNWEWMGAALIRHGLPVTFLIGTQSNPYVDRLFNEYRSHLGIQFVRIKSIKDALRVLKQNGLVALLNDQDGDKWGSFAPFFGDVISTHSIGTLLARKSGAKLVFGVAARQPGGAHKLKVHEIPEAPDGLSDAQATAFLLNEYNSRLEEAVRLDPGQWLWMHNRWRSRPYQRLAGEARQKAERGEIVFDWPSAAWRDAKTNELVATEP